MEGRSRVKGRRPMRRVHEDRALARSGVEVAVGGQRRAEPCLPAPPGAHDVEEALDVGGDRLGHVARQHLFEMPPRQRVLLLQEEGAREFEPHPHKLRAVHQDRAEGGDGLVELLVAGLPVRRGVGDMGGIEGFHAGPEARAGRVLGAVAEIRRVPRGGGAVGRRREKQDRQAQHEHEGKEPCHGVTRLCGRSEERAPAGNARPGVRSVVGKKEGRRERRPSSMQRGEYPFRRAP